ncbi:E3 ubiquitin-protein ligase huwe1 [Sparganum proliferum]
MALFARIRLAVYFSDPEKRSKCIRARLQAISTLCYTFEINDRLLYPSLVDELVDVLQLPDGEFMEIKACALRTMTAIFSSHRVNVNLMSILESTGMSSFHGALPTRIRKWIQGLVDGSCDAAGGSVNQQYTIALLSFLYHLASFEENIGSGSGQNHATTLSTSGILDSMLQLIAWHVPRNDCLSYVTRAVRVTDQILMNAATNRQTVVNRLVDRLGYEVGLVLSNHGPFEETGGQASLLNTQRSGLMKSILNLLKRLCLDTDWNDAVRTSMENNLPQILSSIYKNSVFHFTPHLALFAMETITNYIYTYPSRISNMQDNGITCGILSALTTQPLPQNRDFLVHLPSILNTLALNTRGRAALRSCGILNKYLETLVSPDYLSTMKARRVRDFHSQIYSLAPSAGQAFSTNLTASQMSNSIQELLRSHNELKPTVFQSLVECFRKVVRLGCSQSAPILPPPETLGSNELEGEGSCRSFNQSYPTHSRNLNVFSSENRSGGRMTVTSAAVIDATNPAASRTAGGVLLDEDLVMLSGSEDNGSAEDDDDNDDMPDVSLTASRTTVSSNTSFLTSTARTELIATTASSASERPISATDGDTPDQKPSSSAEASTFSDVPDSFQNLPEYILNLCKFVERLLPSMQHVTEGMCRQFVNQGGLQVLCDLLTMPGLPYDFPVSAACASLCKIFEQLVSYLSLNDLLKPVLQALQDGLSKVDNFLTSETAEHSVLLRDCSANETNVLHGLVCISSILCVLVQIINHLKSEHRCGFASFWVQRNISGQLGKLYHKVSWEAVILLKTICDESKDHNQPGPSTGCPLSVDPNETCGSTQASQSKPSLSMPAFVEALSVYRILKPCLQAHQSAKTKSLAHYILHVCSYFINSVTELCTTLTRFCVASPSQPQRRLLMSSFDQVPLSLKTSVLTQVAQLAIGALCWRPPDSIVNNSEFLLLVYAVRYSSVRLAHLLLFDASSKSPHIQMLNVFYMLNGIQSLFSIFNDLASLNSSTDFLSGALSSVLEEWFACVNRLSNIAAVRAEVKKISETDAIHFDTDKYAHYVSRLSLQPLELLCCHGVLLNYLSQRAAEHLLNMLINIVQYVFTEEPDQLADAEASEKPASGDGAPAPLKTGATSVNPEPDSTPVIAAGDSETSSRTSESSRAAVRMLEEMGFAARTAELALEESNWNTADAVNLLLLSLDDFAPFNFNPSGVAPERPTALFPFPNEAEGPNSVPVQTSGALLDSLIYESNNYWPVSCDPPSEEEIVDAIRKLRNNKAPGEDGIPAEIFKSCVDTLAPWLHEVIERAWRDEVVPDDWGLGILVPILKKGDKTRCENYRGISLIDVAAKIFAIVLLRRFQAVRDSRTRPNQAGFRAGRGCADQIFTLRRILEFRHSYQQPTAVCCVDFAAAFDSVHRESLWRIMALDGVPAKIIAMIKAYYRSTTARVLVRNNLSQPFGIRSGVRQGCILSPILFNYAIDWILERALRDSDGVGFAPGHRLTDLDYADDIALLAPSFDDLQSMVSRVNEVAKSVGLSINAGKTKVFSGCIPDQEKAPLGIDGCQLEEVDSFKYLGARLLPNGQSKDDVVSRIDAARWVFSSLRKCLWNRRDLSIATKIRVYRASVRSVLLYGCECWALRVEDERKLEVFDHHCLRIVLRVKFTDFVSNETVRARCDNIARITQAIQERRLRWFGHVLRRPPQEFGVAALDPAPLFHWRRRRGGQFKTWLDTVRQDMEVVLGPSVFGLRRWRREWVELSRSAAADRHAWRGTVRDIIEAG